MQSKGRFSEKTQEHFMRRVLDRAPSMLSYWDRDLRCLFANPSCGRWFGVQTQGLIGTSIKDLLGPTVFGIHEPHIRAALRGEEQSVEVVGAGADLVKRHGLAYYMPDIVDGEVQGFVIQFTDGASLQATEAALRAEAAARERVEERLRKSEADLRQAQRLGQIGSWRWEASPDVTTWSEEIYRILGLDPAGRPPSYAEHGQLYWASAIASTDIVQSCRM